MAGSALPGANLGRMFRVANRNALALFHPANKAPGSASGLAGLPVRVLEDLPSQPALPHQSLPA